MLYNATVKKIYIYIGLKFYVCKSVNFDIELYTCRHICYSGFVCNYFFVGHWEARYRYL